MKRLLYISPIIASIVVTMASALEIADPTRPPTARTTNVTPQGAAEGAGGASGAATSEAARVSPPITRARLTAIMMADAPGRPAAVIDGRVRSVGDEVPGGVVAQVDANGVTLRMANGRMERLSVYDRPAEPDPADDLRDVKPSPKVPDLPPPNVPTANAILDFLSQGASSPGKEKP